MDFFFKKVLLRELTFSKGNSCLLEPNMLAFLEGGNAKKNTYYAHPPHGMGFTPYVGCVPAVHLNMFGSKLII
jgi:hypothetical protein